MARDCPRCGAELDPCSATPTTGGTTVTLDLCVQCRGLWLERSELAAICPTLSDLPDRRDEIALLGAHGTGIPRCPECPPDASGLMPYEFDVLGAKVDLCTRCGGVWLDGDEYGEVELTLAQQHAAAPPPERAGPYRSQAREEAARTGMARCAWCSTEVLAKDTFMSQSGLICRGCFAAKIQRVADLRAEDAAAGSQGLVGSLLDLLFWRDTSR
jgi:Zn-finger nucleic acid-binding protein